MCIFTIHRHAPYQMRHLYNKYSVTEGRHCNGLGGVCALVSTLVIVVTSASDLPVHKSKFCSAIFGIPVDYMNDVQACCYQHTSITEICLQHYTTHVTIH